MIESSVFLIQGKDQTVSVLRRLLQELGAELQENKSEFSRTSKAAEGRRAEVRRAGIHLLLCVRLRCSGKMIRLSGLMSH